jgi:trehalose synthase-fused probable maltokinase
MVLILGVRADQEPEANYLFPIRTIWECERPPAGIICEVRSGSTTGWIVEGFTDDRFVRSTLDNICRAPNTPGEASGLVFWRSQTFKPDDSFAAESAIGRSGAEQSNTSVVASGGVRTVLCVLQSLVREGEDGWNYVTQRLAELIDRRAQYGGSERELVSLAARLGRRTAELHQALALPTDHPDFGPEPVSKQWLSQWRSTLLGSLDSVLRKARSLEHHEASEWRNLQQFSARAADVEARIRTLVPKNTNAKRTRLHGDFHLGQIIIAKEDVIIVDFEGEPMRSLDDRRGKYLPLRDVAGMLRSLEYARAATARRAQLTEKELMTLQQVVSRMQSAFLSAYAEAIVGCVSFPEDLTQADDLPGLCLIEKSLYEVEYEIANRPEWVDIPTASLIAASDADRHSFK